MSRKSPRDKETKKTLLLRERVEAMEGGGPQNTPSTQTGLCVVDVDWRVCAVAGSVVSSPSLLRYFVVQTFGAKVALQSPHSPFLNGAIQLGMPAQPVMARQHVLVKGS